MRLAVSVRLARIRFRRFHRNALALLEAMQYPRDQVAHALATIEARSDTTVFRAREQEIGTDVAPLSS